MNAQPKPRKPLDEQAILCPHSIEAEQAVIGGVMVDPKALGKISDWIVEDDFFRRDHRLIWRAIVHLAGKRKPFDAVTLGEWLERNEKADIVGGVSAVIELANATPGAANIVAHAEIVKEYARQRECMSVGTGIHEDIRKGASAEAAITNATKQLGQIAITGNALGGLQSQQAITAAWLADLTRRYDAREEISGLRTPWHSLDRKTFGLQNGDLIFLAARPNMGKSIAVNQICVHAAGHSRRRVAQFSLEQTTRAVTGRNVSALAGVPHEWLQSPQEKYADEHADRFRQVMESLGQLAQIPLWIDDTPQLTAAQICGRARREHLRSPIGLVVVDTLNAIGRPGINANSEYGQASKMFKALGKELNCPVIVCCQLSRELLKRRDPRPIMSDLRDCGELEQDGDVILFLHREDYYDRNTKRKGIVEIEIGKGKDIKTGQRVYLENEFQFMRMVNIERDISDLFEDAEPDTGSLA